MGSPMVTMLKFAGRVLTIAMLLPMGGKKGDREGRQDRRGVRESLALSSR